MLKIYCDGDVIYRDADSEDESVPEKGPIVKK